METDAPDRHLTFENAFNVRDLGGYPAAGGRTTAWRTLFRGDGVHRLPAEAFHELGIRTVIDLRTPEEVEHRGRVAHDGLDWHNLPVIKRMWEAEWFLEGTPPERFLADRYLEMVDEGGAELGRSLCLLAEAERVPALFHCAAGKDRTGVLAALVLSLLGVDDDTVAADYGLSRLGMAALDAYVRERYADADTMQRQPSVFMDAPEAAMHVFLADVRARHGSVEAYAASVGAGADVVDALRANLLTG
jgi:hypothetical protein